MFMSRACKIANVYQQTTNIISGLIIKAKVSGLLNSYDSVGI